MNNSMVAHLWANEKKESARGSNLFFEGRSIYSYGYHFEVGRIVRNKCSEKAYLLNDKYYSSSTCKHQRCVRSAIPTGSKVFSVGYNMSDDGSMAFITSRLELIKEVIEKYKKVRTSLSYRDVWGVFRSLMDYIEFFNMGTPKSLLKKSANTWIGTKHELSYESDKIKSDLDNVGDDGVLIKPLEEIPCPFCRTEEFIRYDPFNKEYSMDSEEDIRDWYMSYINEMRNKYGGK